jgi:hypothetical protein
VTIRKALWGATQHIYVIKGPTGIYVGASTNPEQRRRQHWAVANSSPRWNESLIADAMRHDGRDLYAFEVVACARNAADGQATEYALVEQLRAEGERVLNVFPRTPLHVGGFKGRFVGVVVNGRVEPLFPAAEPELEQHAV